MSWYEPNRPLMETIAAENQSYINTYRDRPQYITEHYQWEQHLQNAYQGRELFELIQNATDAARDVEGDQKIELRLEGEVLYCANTGSSITPDGLEAIRGTYLSTKPFDAIGHFGVGFKSVLNLSDDPAFLSTEASFRFDVTCPALREIAPNAPGYPRLRLLIPITNPIEDEVLAALRWATTVVHLPLRQHIATSLREQFQAFPAEFALFSPHVNELRFTNDGAERGISQQAERQNNGSTYVLLRQGDGPEQPWRLFSHDMPPNQVPEGAETPFRQGQVIGRIPIVWAVPLDIEQTMTSQVWAFFPTETSLGVGGILNAPWATEDNRKRLDLAAKKPYNQGLAAFVCKSIADDFLILRDDFKASPGRLLDLLPAVPTGRVERLEFELTFRDQLKERLAGKDIIRAGDKWVQPDQGWLPGGPLRKREPLNWVEQNLWNFLWNGRRLCHPDLYGKDARATKARDLGVEEVPLSALLPKLVGMTPGEWAETSRKALELAALVLQVDENQLATLRGIKFIPCTDGALHPPADIHLAAENSPDVAGLHFPIAELRRGEGFEHLKRLGIVFPDDPRVEALKRRLAEVPPRPDLAAQQAWAEVWRCFQDPEAPPQLVGVLREHLAQAPNKAWVQAANDAWKRPGRLLRNGAICPGSDWDAPYRVDEKMFGQYTDEVCSVLGIKPQPTLRHPEAEPWFDRADLLNEFKRALHVQHPNAPSPQAASLQFGSDFRVPGPLEMLQDHTVPADYKTALVRAARQLIQSHPDRTNCLTARYIWNNANVFLHSWIPSPIFGWAQGLGFDLNPPPPLPTWTQFIQGIQTNHAQGGDVPDAWVRQCAPVEREHLEDGPGRDRAWLTLFLFAGAHSAAWGHAARASGFVGWCQGAGHLDTMIMHPPHPDDHGRGADAWMRLLWQQNLSSDEEFDFTFRSLFARMFRMTAYLDAYRQYFLSFNRWPQGQPIEPIWLSQPNTNPHLPDHLRGQLDLNMNRILGPKGTVVVIRELQRLGILNHPQLVPFGFVPSGRLLRRLELDDSARGLAESRMIYQRIHEGLDPQQPWNDAWFDIPFTGGLW